ncbi:MAG: glycosyltransferase family 8 protein [Byssovorax sp.]
MKKAYAVTLCNGEGYLPGVEALGSSLASSGTTEPKVLMVTPEVRMVTRDRLAAQGWIIREIAPIPNPNPATQRMLPRFSAAYTKLRAWQLTDFDKVVLLDADTLVMKNVDDLFDRPELAAAPDFFLPDRFNSGVMVIEPSESIFDRMIHALGHEQSYDGGDQGFLNLFFAGWYASSIEHRLPTGYNIAHFIYQFMHSHASAWKTLQHEIKIVHYLVQKPWKSHPTLTGASDIWWSAYFKVHPEKAESLKHRLHEAEDWSFDALTHLFVG